MKAITVEVLPEHLLGQVVFLQHPFAKHFITTYRSNRVSIREMRAAVNVLFQALMFKAFESYRCNDRRVVTPMNEAYEGHQLSQDVIFAPIVRAGEGAYDTIFEIFPDAPICHLELERVPDTLEIVERKNRLPDVISPQTWVVFTDPAFATSHTIAHAVNSAKQRGATKILVLSFVAAIPGVIEFCAQHSDVPVYTCGLDPTLDENGYIHPGIGGAGEKYFNTEH